MHLVRTGLNIEAVTKLPTFLRWHFNCIGLNEIILCVLIRIYLFALRIQLLIRHYCRRLGYETMLCAVCIAIVHMPYHDDVIKWKPLTRYWPSVWGIHRSPLSSPREGQWRRALRFSLICAWKNIWVSNGDAGYLKHHRAHYGVTVIFLVKTKVVPQQHAMVAHIILKMLFQHNVWSHRILGLICILWAKNQLWICQKSTAHRAEHRYCQ